MTRALKDRLAELERLGFADVNLRHGKHIKIDALSPGGQPTTIVVSTTPSDWRVGKKFRAQLRLAGRGQEDASKNRNGRQRGSRAILRGIAGE